MTERLTLEEYRATRTVRRQVPLLPPQGPAGKVTIILAGVPTPYREKQRAFQTGKTGEPITYSYKVTATRHYQNWLRHAAMQAMGDRAPFDCAVSMVMTAYMPIPKSSLRKAERLLAEQELLPVTKRPDTTQLLKAAEDALTSVVWTDDSRVSRHVLERLYSPRPRIEIAVEPWQPKAPA